MKWYPPQCTNHLPKKTHKTHWAWSRPNCFSVFFLVPCDLPYQRQASIMMSSFSKSSASSSITASVALPAGTNMMAFRGRFLRNGVLRKVETWGKDVAEKTTWWRQTIVNICVYIQIYTYSIYIYICIYIYTKSNYNYVVSEFLKIPNGFLSHL